VPPAAQFRSVLAMSVMYLHLGAFARVLVSDLDRQIAELNIGVVPEAPIGAGRVNQLGEQRLSSSIREIAGNFPLHIASKSAV
jgi:hypothetical protein